MPKYAYVTYVMNGDFYVIGAITLAKSIKKSRYNSKEIDLVCIVTHDVTELDELNKHYDHVIVVEYIQHESYIQERLKLLYNWIDKSYTKWNCLNLIQYEKILYLDSDCIMMKNMDHLFTCQPPMAVFEDLYSRDLIKLKSYQRKLGMRKRMIYRNSQIDVFKGQIDQVDIQGGLCGNHRVCLLSSGTVLLSPSTEHFKKLKSILYETPIYGHEGCNSGSEEQLIAELYLTLGIHWTALPLEYGLISREAFVNILGIDNIYVLHYFGKEKPWNMKDYYDDIKYWWSIHLDTNDVKVIKREFLERQID
jgi:alpha-N-acetylglucosamine transferase